MLQALIHPVVQRLGRFYRTGRNTGEQFQTLVNMGDGIHVKLPATYSFYHIRTEHEVADIRLWNDHSLRAGELTLPADIVKPFYFFIDAPDGLDVTPLVDRARDSEILPYGKVCQAR